MIIKIKILVAAHKVFPMPADKNLYMPILVGATRNFHEGIDYQRDDTGENISVKNPNYNELTAVYWAWKNLKNVDVIGLVHYRRILSPKRRGGFKSILTTSQITKMLQSYDIILPKKRHYYIESNYSHYVHAHHSEPLKETRKVIAKMHPDYLSQFDIVMNRRSAHMFNMFIMKRELFDQYCQWLFSILQQVEKNVDFSDYSVQESRVFGYLSELLMDVWVQTNQINYVECNWQQLGRKQTLKKIFYFVSRKFGWKFDKTHF